MTESMETKIKMGQLTASTAQFSKEAENTQLRSFEDMSETFKRALFTLADEDIAKLFLEVSESKYICTLIDVKFPVIYKFNKEFGFYERIEYILISTFVLF